MLFDSLEKILRIYNLIDDICIVDKDGIIVHAESFVNGVYAFDLSKIVGKHIFDVYPSSNIENSNLYKALQSHKPEFNYKTEWKTYMGDMHSGIVDTLPIFIDEEFAGAIEIARFSGDKYKHGLIKIAKKQSIQPEKIRYSLDDIITCNPLMLALKKKISRIAENESNVLIYGETGTGKELVAQAIHEKSERRDKPFISQNCAAIPTELLEGILFGTEKGGFTGAEKRKGLFELADGGTLFLDEINLMGMGGQSKILKVLEEKRIMRLGAEMTTSINVRIICAMNEDPLDAIKQNHLREDLFYRLSAVVLTIPPLRERIEDIVLLTDTFIERFSKVFNHDISGVDEDVLKTMQSYAWPGNVRQLKNLIEGAFNLCEEEWIHLEHIPEYIVSAVNREKMDVYKENGLSLKEKVEAFEKNEILKALRIQNKKKDVAQMLGISRQLLNEKIKKYEIEGE